MAFWNRNRSAPEPAPQGDPALDDFQKAMAAVQAAPPGDAGTGMSPEQVAHEVRRLRELLRSGRYAEAWAQRVHLGYDVPLDGVERSDAFWINAAGALAALRSGQKQHPMVAMCAGVCEQYLDSSDAEQAAAKDEIYERYFG
jgi:hypothetical protein